VHSVLTPRQSYAESFENVRREGHNCTPLVAYCANNYRWVLPPCRREREAGKKNPNLLLTERESRTGEYWLELISSLLWHLGHACFEFAGF